MSRLFGAALLKNPPTEHILNTKKIMGKIISLIASFWDGYKTNPYTLISFMLLGVIVGGASVMKDMYDDGIIEQQNHLADLRACNEISLKQDSIYKLNQNRVKKTKKK